jgi:hypothetical protein
MSVRQSVKANPHEVRCNENEALVLGRLPSIALNLEALTLGHAFANIAGKRDRGEMESENVDDWGTLTAGMFEGAKHGNAMKRRYDPDLLNWRNKWIKITKAEVLFFEDPKDAIEWKKSKALGNSEPELSASAKPRSQMAAVWKIERASQIVSRVASFSIGQDGSNENCVTVNIIPPTSPGGPARFDVSSLFYRINDTSVCEMESANEKGWGTFVFNTITMAAAQSHAYCGVWDDSIYPRNPQGETGLQAENKSLTQNLLLIRGYGFYEGLGVAAVATFLDACSSYDALKPVKGHINRKERSWQGTVQDL